MTSTAGRTDLEVGRPRHAAVGVAAALALVVVALGAWYVTHPPRLPTTDTPLRASVPVGENVYLGSYAPQADDARTLHLIDVVVAHSGDAEVTALVCRAGSLGVTTAPDAFCDELVDAAGTDLAPGDQLVLEVRAGTAGSVTVRRPRLTYRDGVQRGTHDAGAPAEVEVLDR